MGLFQFMQLNSSVVFIYLFIYLFILSIRLTYANFYKPITSTTMQKIKPNHDIVCSLKSVGIVIECISDHNDTNKRNNCLNLIKLI